MFSERRLADAQAGVFCHVRFWGELESLGDREANGEDPCQTGEREASMGCSYSGCQARQENRMTDSNCPCKAHTYWCPVHREV